MKKEEIIGMILNGDLDNTLADIYGDVNKIQYQKDRYIKAVNVFVEKFGDCDLSIFSAPGRSEIGGNHTDHQHGEVLAASVNLDSIAVAAKTYDRQIIISSSGYEELVIPLDKIRYEKTEEGTTLALVKGVLSKMMEMGYKVGGFKAYVTSDVLIGAGLSSSAAYETLIGTIISGLYNDMSVSAIDIAIIGQYAENVFFGKPCGLMDQMACSVGNLVHVDFANPKEPVVEKVEFDMSKYGYSLCITDTKGSHADLTDEYAAIPGEMKAVAQLMGREVLLEITEEEVLNCIDDIREKLGDRALLRTLHFINENERVRQEVAALRNCDIDGFLKIVKQSGDSSYKYLQNVYTNSDVRHQNVSVALALSDTYLKEKGACRVHGGGFAGTIQAFVRDEDVDEYKARMDKVFGNGACNALKIRKYGGIKIV